MDVECAKCRRSMVKILQYDENGIDTHLFHCDGCGGRAALQDDSATPKKQEDVIRIETAPETIRIQREALVDAELTTRIRGGLEIEPPEQQNW